MSGAGGKLGWARGGGSPPAHPVHLLCLSRHARGVLPGPVSPGRWLAPEKRGQRKLTLRFSAGRTLAVPSPGPSTHLRRTEP